MPVTNASREAILKAETKDEFYRNFSRQHVNKSFQAIFGDRALIKWQNELKVFADLLYFGLTTMSGLQTLGEEYGGMIQIVDKKQIKIPSLMRRSVYVFIKSISPYLSKKIFEDTKILHYFEGLNEKEKLQFKVVLDFIKNFIPTLHHVHTVIFYLHGVYYSIAKRLLGIQYVLVRPPAQNETDVNAFKMFAAFTVIQIICNAFKQIKNFSKEMQRLEATEKTSHNLFPLNQLRKAKHSVNCLLCLENITYMSATPCGHVFCWSCIVEAINIKAECPACRKPTKLTRIIYLQHYHCV